MIQENSVLSQFYRMDVMLLGKISQLENCLQNLQYEGKPSLGKNLKELALVDEFFSGHLKSYLSFEERVLYPFLNKHLPRISPLLHVLQLEIEKAQCVIQSFSFATWVLKFNAVKGEQKKVISEIVNAGTYLNHAMRGLIQLRASKLYGVLKSELRYDEKTRLSELLDDWLNEGGSHGFQQEQYEGENIQKSA